MILPIYTYGESQLREKSVEIDLNDPTLPELIDNLYDTMQNTCLEVAICGPNIGVNKRIFIIQGDDEDEGNFNGAFINPKILSTGGYIYDAPEACLSFYGVKCNVKRPTIVELEWWDDEKNYHREFFVEIQARIIQHQIDHLDGILMVDRTDEDELLKITSVLEDHKKKKIKFSYPIHK